jgi:Zn finger protein HypA/HybF involved in hydrogenase expression
MSHGISIAKNIIDEVKNKDKVEHIEIEVGELAEISAKELKEIIEKLTGWKVITKEMESKVKCACGYVGRAKIKSRQHDIVIYVCPGCGSVPTPIIGQDIKLKRVVYH